ncbi:MAG: RNA 3'-terminal phosphate cyclase [Candidatus Hodarchaeota archaeon]
MELLEIDGSKGEGGGSILRLSAALGIIFKKRIHVYNIRAGRKVPGLRAQHVMGLQALKELSNGKLEGANVKSMEITFEPGEVKPGNINIKIGTAGSIGLVYQILSIACAGIKLKEGEKIEVNINGGATFGKWAPASSYISYVLIPLLKIMGFQSELVVQKHGFYPKGGAAAKIKFSPNKKLNGLVLEDRGAIEKIEGESVATTHLKNPRVSERQMKSARQNLSKEIDPSKISIKYNYVDALNPGSGITLWAKTSKGCILSSGSVIGEKGVSSEKVGGEASKELLNLILGHPEATVDEYSSDQLIPFMALCKEKSLIVVPKLTKHAKTNIELLKMFSNRPVNIDERKNKVMLEFPSISE